MRSPEKKIEGDEEYEEDLSLPIRIYIGRLIEGASP